MIYLSFEELSLREGEKLPLLGDGTVNTAKVTAALEDASNVIRTYLPDLIDGDGLPVDPPPARIAGTLKTVTRDIAVYFLSDMNGEEFTRKRYEDALRLLKSLGGNGGGKSEGESGPEPLEESGAELIGGSCSFKRGEDIEVV